jgi:hypothetical protein
MLNIYELKKVKKALEKFKAELKKIDKYGYYPQSCLMPDFERVLEEDLLAVELIKIYPNLDDSDRLKIARKILQEEK